ncbi:MAG TPA: hypothetical protein VN241_11820, partial [Microbacterium sp.]|nr:hypothetical protein [Microbacterium sp.]
ASALAAAGVRQAIWVIAAWTPLVGRTDVLLLGTVFGAEFAAHRQAVPCWIPRATARSPLHST